MAIILFGYYGFNNVGDEQLLDESVRLIKQKSDSIPFFVANGPYATPFPAFNRWNVFQWVSHLFRAKVLLFGGGSLFQSQTSRWSLFYYLFIVILAKSFRCKIVLLCHGWGPFKRKWHERFTVWVLKNCERSWRIPIGPKEFFNDHIFCDLTQTQPVNTNPSSESKKLGLALRAKQDISSLTSFFASHFSEILVLDNQPKKHSKNVSMHDIWNKNQLGIGFVVTDRFHTAIWASRHGIGWIAISNDPKLIRLASSANQPCYSSAKDLFSSNDWKMYQSGAHLQNWSTSFQSMRAPIKKWLYEYLPY